MQIFILSAAEAASESEAIWKWDKGKEYGN